MALKFSQKCFRDTEVVVQRCFVKKVFLENSQIPVNFTKFLRTPFYIEHLWWLLLFDSYFMSIAKGKLCFSLICSFYCYLVKRGWGLKVAQQFSMRGLLFINWLLIKKKCSKSIPGFTISRLANVEDFFNVNIFFKCKYKNKWLFI